MKLLCLITVFFMGIASLSSTAYANEENSQAHRDLMTNPALDLANKEGEERLINSKYSSDYWALNSYYLTQEAQSCGLGSAVMVLNALNIFRPGVEEYFNRPLFTPTKFLQAINHIITQEEIKAGCMNLKVLADALRTFSLQAIVIHADSITTEDLRIILKENLNDPQAFIIANYHRPSIGHKGKGNFAPIGAYDEASDSVLLLDPLRDQQGPFWVQVEDIFKSMNEVDASGETRGLILVKRLYVEIFSEKGMRMIKNSQFREGYFKFSRYFETQEHWTYCGIASSVAAMNTLQDQVVFSQENFFTDEVEKIVTAKEVKTDWRGLTADELVQILPIHGFSATFVNGDTFTADAFRNTLKTTLNNTEEIIIANYNRPETGQVGGGHFSPIVAYDQDSDCVLIMDTSRFKYPPVWIDLNMFVKAMSTQDSAGIYRGYLTIKKLKEE